MKKLENNKIIKILLAVLLVVSLVFAGTALGKYVVDKVLDDTITLNITGAPQGNILMAGDYGAGFAATIKALDGEGENLQKIVFCGKDELPASISDWDGGENVDAANRGTVKAFYDESTKTIYVASKDNEKIIANTDSGYLFRQMTSLTAIEGLDFVDTSAAETMASMFQECSNLVSLDVSNFDTGNVKDMSRMFEYCNSLPSLDVSSFNTTQVTEMSAMFCFCENLDVLNLSNFDTSKVTNMNNMFYYCKGLESLDISNFDTSKVEYMIGVFGWCSSLTNLNVSSFDTSKVLSMNSMFEHCQSLTDLDVTGFDTTNVTDVSWMFYDCTNLQTLNLSSFNTQNFANMSTMFADCFSLTTIYVNKDWDVSHIVNSRVDTNGDGVVDDSESTGNGRGLFTGCNNLVGGQGTSHVDIYSSGDVYADDSNYAVIDKAQELQEDGTYGAKGYLTLYEAYTLTDGLTFSTAFNNLQLLYFDATTITFGSYNELKGEIGDIWNDASVTYEIVDDKGQGTIRAYAITDDEGYTGIYVVSKDSSVIFANQDCSYMFDTMLSFVSLTNIWGLNNVDTRNTTNMSNMFAFNLELFDVDVSGFDTSKVTDMSAMFGGCTSLNWLDVSNFDTSNVTNMNGMFAQCPVYSLDVSGFDTSKVTNMGSMFASCTELWDLNLSNWNTSNVTNMASMFDECTSLETIYAGAGWNTDKVTSHNLMFDNCTALVGGQGTAFDANYIDKTYALIDAAREPGGAKGYLTDANYGVNSKVLLPGGEFNAELAALLTLTGNEGVTKVQFGDANQFSEALDFSVWDDEAWAANADAILDVARSGNISAFVVDDTVYILAKEADYDDQYNSVIYANADCANMFRHNVGDETGYIPEGRLTAIEGLSLVDTGNTTTMAYMFSGCAGVSALDLSGFDTANVTDMNHMFSGCTSLGGLNLSGFNTSKVTNMESMFFECDAITALNLSKWDVSKVTNMNAMFSSCDMLNTLNLTGWTTSNVTDMTAMFSGCPALNTIYVDTNWTTEKVVEDENMFNGCTALVGGQTTTLADTGNIVDKTYAVIDRYVSDGTRGYLTYEEAYTLISGPNFSWMLWDGDGKDGYYGLSDDIIEWEGWDGGDVRITKIVFGSFDEYKDTLGLTSWDNLAPGIALDAEQEGNIRLYIPGFDWSNTQGDSYDQTYYVLSKGSSKIIANENCSGLLRSGHGWEEAYGLTWDVDNRHLAEIVGLNKLDTCYVTDMSMMFEYFAGESLDLSNFVTSNVTDMSYMFNNCNILTSLDVTGLITDKVTNMRGMFDTCSALETIDVSKFETGNVTDMSHMFNGMGALTALDVSSFDTSKVTDMSHMFSWLYVSKLDISNFSTAGYPYIDGMFYGCMNTELGKHLTTIYASDLWNPDKVRVDEYGYAVFGDSEMLVGGEGSTYAETAATDSDNDYKFARIDEKVSSGTMGLFTDKNAIPTGDFTLKIGSEFNSAVSKLIADNNTTKIQFGSWAQYGAANGFDWYGDATAVTLDVDDRGIKAFVKDGTIYILSGGNMFANADSSTMFQNMSTLTAIDGLGSVDTGNVTDMSSMFYGCSGLTSLDVTSFDVYDVKNMSAMFRGCSGLTSLDVTKFVTYYAENMSHMFRGCSGLTSLDVTNFWTANVTDMSHMFRDCTGLTSLDVTTLDTGHVVNMQSMFYNLRLTELDLSKMNIFSAQNLSFMFSMCTELTSLDLSGFSSFYLDDVSHMFDGCSSLEDVNLEGWYTGNVTNMSSMFYGCTALKELDFSDFDTSKVTDMGRMLYGCTNLTTVFVTDLWSTESVSTGGLMFYDCVSIVGGEGTTYDNAYTDATKSTWGNNRARIDGGTENPGYLTDRNNAPAGTFTLKAGSTFANAVKNLISSSSATQIQFGSWETFGKTNGFDWYGDTTAVVLDVNDEGTIKAFAKDGIIYILSGGDMYANASCSNMFAGMMTLTAIKGLDAVDTSNVTDMQFMFNACNKLESLDLSSWDTSNVENMMNMFTRCTSLTSLDLSGFETGSVINMSAMFSNCIALESVDLSSFDTSGVKSMINMFNRCSSLTTLDLSNFDTSAVTQMLYMFNNCSALETIYVSSARWSTASMSETEEMFTACTVLKGGAGTEFAVAGVIDSSYAHIDGGTANPGYLSAVPVTLTTGSIFNDAIQDLFSTEVTKLQFGTYDDVVGTNTDMVTLWNDSTNFVDVDGEGTARVFTSGDTVYVLSEGSSPIYANANSSWMFVGSTSDSTNMIDDYLTEIVGLETVNTSKVTNMQAMFQQCTVLTSVDVSKFDTSNVLYMDQMFYLCSNVTKLDVSGWNMSRVKTIKLMFARCSKLEELNVSQWNTQSVTDMGDAFYYCSSLKTLDVSGFNTKNVRSMYEMFRGCSGLTSLDVSSWDTSNVTSPMSYMFYDCTGLTALDVSSWDTSNVTGMYAMFRNCQALTTLDVSNWDTGNVTDMSYMFYNCTALPTLNVSGWNTANVKTMQAMFYACKLLTPLDVSNWDTGNVTNMISMFSDCESLTYLDVSNWDTSSLESMGSMFWRCIKLSELDVSNWDTKNVTSMSSTFYNCNALEEIDVSNWDTSKVTSMYNMFCGCYKLTALDVSNFDTSKVTNISYMFNTCSNLISLDVSGFDTSSVTDMSGMFNACYKITSLDLSSFDTGSVTKIRNMFWNCNELQTIYVSEDLWDMSGIDTTTDAGVYMFVGCDKLVGGEGTTLADVYATDSTNYLTVTYACIDKAISEGVKGYLTSNASYMLDATAFNTAMNTLNPTKIVFGQYGAYADTFAWDSGTYMLSNEEVKYFNDSGTVYVLSKGRMRLNVNASYNLFRNLTSLQQIEGLDRLDTSGVTDMMFWFGECSSLTSVDLSGLDTSSVEHMGSMFYGCTSLTSVNLSGIDTSNVIDFSGMFWDCSSLATLDLSGFDTSSATGMGGMFYGCTSLTTIYANDWDVSKVTSCYEMFYNCKKLKGGAGTQCDGDTDRGVEYAHIDGGTSNPGYFTDPAQAASASVLSLYDVSVTEVEEAGDTEVVEPDSIEVEEADGTEVEDSEQDAATTEPEADSTVEEILPESQEKEETESEPEADSTVEEILPESQEKEETESEPEADSTVEEILPESQEKEETESEPEADSTVEEILPESQEKEETESEPEADTPVAEGEAN